MIGLAWTLERRPSLLFGSSAVAIAAALAAIPDSAGACTWEPSGPGVAVTCLEGQDATPFSTVAGSLDYDGNEADTIDMLGGIVFQNSESGPPSNGDFDLAPSPVITTNGGNDTFNMSGGQVGVETDRVDIFLGPEDPDFAGSDNDVFTMSGGTIYGNVDGLQGDDRFEISGGLISGYVSGWTGNDSFFISGGEIELQVSAGAGDDTIVVSGDNTVIGQGPYTDPDFPDALPGLVGGAGDDRIELQGGWVANIGSDSGPASDDTGNDTVIVSGGTVGGFVNTGTGDDRYEQSGGVVNGLVELEDGADAFVMSGGGIGNADVASGVFLGGGADTFDMTGGTIFGSVFGQGGGNIFEISGGTITQSLFAGSENDSVTISGGANIQGSTADPDAIGLEDGDDEFIMTGGNVGAAVSGGAGADSFEISGGTIAGLVAGNDGNDSFLIGGSAAIAGNVLGGDGDDSYEQTGGSVAGLVDLGAGVDSFTMSAGQIGTADVASGVLLGDGADTFDMTGGTVFGSVFGQGGGNTFEIGGGTITQSLFAGSGNDTVTISGGANVQGTTAAPDAIGLEDGDDRFVMTGGNVGAAVSGGAGNDRFEISGGTISGFVAGNAGDDSFLISGGTLQAGVSGNEGTDEVEVRGGTINGGIEAETVRLYGGTINGDVTGLSGDTLIIDGSVIPGALTLIDGITFSGTGAVGTITAIDLAAGGSQNFTGFATLGLDGSTIRFADDTTQGIAALTLDNASTLFAGENVTLNGSLSLLGGSTFVAGNGMAIAGGLSLAGSTINLVNGAATDVVTLGGLTLNGATLGIDLDQNAGLSDRLTSTGVVTALGANTIMVNLLAPPVLLETVEVSVIDSAGPILGGGTFTVTGIPGTVSALFDYEAIQGPTGVTLRATPNATSIGLVTALDAAAAAAVAETMTNSLYTILWDASEYALGLSPYAPLAPVAATPNFGVFASGQFARVSHDGFTATDGITSFAAPSFTSDDFSAAISLDFNLAKYFDIDDQYGLNFGVFGGYTSTDLTLGSFGGMDPSGFANNESGQFGSYALFRKGFNYLLVSGIALVGETDVRNGLLGGATGSYDTFGYAFSASAGRIFVLSDRLRFDLRGGILGANFEGDPYVDSLGLAHGASEISFGAVKFEPGIYGDFALENGRVFSPYLRGELQQRFGYENVASAGGTTFEFDDSDFSAALSAGFNLRLTPSATVSAEIRGRASSDSTTIAGKFGLKVAF